MSVGWIGVEEVVEESRNGCIVWIAVLVRRAEGVRGVERDVEGAGFDEVGRVMGTVLLRSWTFIDAAEPGMRLTSVGALRKVEAEASGGPAAGFDGGLAAMLSRVVCGER